MSNRARDTQCICIGKRALNLEFDDMLNAFSVFYDLLRQRQADLFERCRKVGGALVCDGARRVVVMAADRDAACSTGKQQNRVVGRGVAIDGDAVEGALDGMVQ